MLLLQLTVLLAVVGLGFVLEAWQLHRSLDQRFEQRALDVAETLAAQPALGTAVRNHDQPAVQRQAQAVRSATGALFVVVTDDHGIRLAHPNPGEIGRPVSTSPERVLRGQEVANIERGTLGLSARGKVPLRARDGAIVGEVSVGFGTADISSALHRLLEMTALLLGVAVLLGVAGSLLLARLLKRRTFGLEPSDLAELVRERDAVLFAIREGVIALDNAGVITMVNTEALRLIGRRLEPGDRLLDQDFPEPLQRALNQRASNRRQGTAAVAVLDERVLVVTRRAVHHAGRWLGSVVTLFDRTEVERLTGELDAVRLMTQALRAQRHEFANRLHTVHGLLHTGGRREASEYVDALLGSSEVRSGEGDAVAPAPIRAYLAAKSTEAARLGVQLRLSEASWVPGRLLAPVEVITVLGNLVSNALEACQEASRQTGQETSRQTGQGAGQQTGQEANRQTASEGGREAQTDQEPARVEVDLLADGTELVISVADTGPGIPVGRLEGIFAAGVSSHGPGRGSGLAIVRSTAESLGGTVRITHPGGDGSMTVFVARLPHVLQSQVVIP